MRLEQLEYFVATADAGSISAAALQLAISQPAVSAAVKSLEHELGAPLLKRGNQGVSLTPLGQSTCEDARKMLELARVIRARGKEAKAEGQAHVCAQPLLSFHLTSTILMPFGELHPKIGVFIRNVPMVDIISELKSGHSNIAVTLVSVGLNIRAQAQSMGCEIAPLYTDERRIFIGAGHPLAAKAQLSQEDLKTLRIAYYSHGPDHVSRLYAPWFAGEYRLANREDILELVMRNEAVFIQAQRMFHFDYRVGKGLLVAKAIPLPHLDHSAPIAAIRTPAAGPAECLLWQYLVTHFARGL